MRYSVTRAYMIPPASRMMLGCSAILLLLAAGALFTHAAAQQAPPHHLIGTLAPPEPAPRCANAFAASALDVRAFQQQRTRRWEGAFVGAVVGALATHLVLHQGGSTSLCDRDANQDAIRAKECGAITALGGLVGGGAGYLIGGRIRVGPVR